jgi:hypothetical protein
MKNEISNEDIENGFEELETMECIDRINELGADFDPKILYTATLRVIQEFKRSFSKEEIEQWSKT